MFHAGDGYMNAGWHCIHASLTRLSWRHAVRSIHKLRCRGLHMLEKFIVEAESAIAVSLFGKTSLVREGRERAVRQLQLLVKVKAEVFP